MRFRKEDIDNLMIDDLELRNKNWDEANKLSEESESLTAQLAQKVGGGVKAEPEDLSVETLGMITGEGGPINIESVPQDYSVTPKKTTFFSKKSEKNLFDGNYVGGTLYAMGHDSPDLYKYIPFANGDLYNGRIAIVPVEPNKTYTLKYHKTEQLERLRIGASSDLVPLQENAGDINLSGEIPDHYQTLRRVFQDGSPVYSKTVTTETNENFLYISHTGSNGSEPLLQVEEGAVATDYIPGLIIPKEYLDPELLNISDDEATHSLDSQTIAEDLMDELSGDPTKLRTELELGNLDLGTGLPLESGNRIRTKDYNKMEVGDQIRIDKDYKDLIQLRVLVYSPHNMELERAGAYVDSYTGGFSANYEEWFGTDYAYVKLVMTYKDERVINSSDIPLFADAVSVMNDWSKKIIMHDTTAVAVNNMENGSLSIAEGTPMAQNNRIRTVSFLEVQDEGIALSIKDNENYKFRVLYYDSNKEFLGLGTYRTEKMFLATSTGNFIKVIVSKINDEPIVDGDFDEISKQLVYHVKDKYAFEYLHENVVANELKPNYYWLDTLDGIYKASDNLVDVDSTTHETVYNFYDQLVADFPERVSSNVLGHDALGNEIREYVFGMTALQPQTQGVINVSGTFNKKPRRLKFLVTGGVHGNEKIPMRAAARFFDELYRNPENKEILDVISSNVDFRVVPLVNPNGVDSNTRANHNGLDLNRNFTDSDTAEEETKVVINWLEEHHDDAFFHFDWHDHPYDGTGDLPMAFVSNDDTATLVYSLFRTLTREWSEEYGYDPTGETTGYLGNEIGGNTLTRYAESLGIGSIILEVGRYSFRHSSRNLDHERTSLEVFANFIITVLKSA